ncbi:Somatostatin receptor type 5, partial [Orchesella cincta]
INCNIFWPESETMSGELIFIWYSFVIGFAAPVSLTLVFYIITFLRFLTVGTQNQNSFTEEQREITKLVLSLVTVHFAVGFHTGHMLLV